MYRCGPGAGRNPRQGQGLRRLERHDHIRPMLALQDWGSMFLNSLAVSGAHRGFGIGAALLGWAEARAAEAGYDRLSLHVWGRQHPLP